MLCPVLTIHKMYPKLYLFKRKRPELFELMYVTALPACKNIFLRPTSTLFIKKNFCPIIFFQQNITINVYWNIGNIWKSQSQNHPNHSLCNIFFKIFRQELELCNIVMRERVTVAQFCDALKLDNTAFENFQKCHTLTFAVKIIFVQF